MPVVFKHSFLYSQLASSRIKASLLSFGTVTGQIVDQVKRRNIGLDVLRIQKPSGISRALRSENYIIISSSLFPFR